MRALVFATGLILLIAACSQEKQEICKYEVGQLVKTVQGGHIGMVVGVRRKSWSKCGKGSQYHIRFDTRATWPDTHILNSDDVNRTAIFVKQTLYGFELKPLGEVRQ